MLSRIGPSSSSSARSFAFASSITSSGAGDAVTTASRSHGTTRSAWLRRGGAIAVAPGAQKTTEKTTTTQKTTGNTTVTKSTTTGFSVGVPATSTTVVTKAAQDIPVYCELQITTDADGDITDIRATGDTQSVGFVGSRCAEILGVKPK